MKFGAKLLFKKGLDVASRAITFKIGKKLIVEVKKHTPELYKIGTSKIKYKNLKKALESDVANYIAEETCKKKKKTTTTTTKKKCKKKTDANNFFG